jgi:hypothetical protein
LEEKSFLPFACCLEKLITDLGFTQATSSAGHPLPPGQIDYFSAHKPLALA